ncbi:MAG: carbohydrate porin [Pseudolabrys sp.]|nr:carbohydrate porin [Pseudolabrys sp.]
MRFVGFVAIALCATTIPVELRAQSTIDSAGSVIESADPDGITRPSIATSLPNNGDSSGSRKRLAERGFTYVFNYTQDILSNLAGGNRRGTIEQGKLETIFTLDFEKFAGWHGLVLSGNTFIIHNTGRIRRDYVGGINTIAAIEATPTVRLSELWLEQKFANDKAAIRAGQLAVDNEFFFTDSSLMFLQSDWPTITAQNLPSGGPAYPLTTPGARLKLEPIKDMSFLFAIFNGDPAGPGPGDPDTRNRYGLNFRIHDSPLLISEAQFRTNQAKEDEGLARTIKLGVWDHTGNFADQRFSSDGNFLASPVSNGIPLQHRGDWGVYGAIDQQLYRLPGGGKDKGVSVFAMASYSPPDRNQIDKYLTGGIVFAGLLPQRPNDRFGASFIYARFSDALRAFDQDTIAFSGIPGVVRDYEANLELTYQAQIIPGWTVSPTFQYIWHPSGQAGRNATVTGIRTIARF